MFSIFNKREATGNGKHRPDGHAVAASPRVKKIADSDETFHLDIPVDDAMRAIDARLSSLAHIEVGQAAKERTWAALHRELERHPVRPTAPALLKGTGAKPTTQRGGLQPVPAPAGHSRGWRIALSSAGAVVVILAAVLGVYGAGLLGNGTEPIAVTTTGEVAVVTTGSTDAVTPSSDSTVPGDVTVTTQAPDTTDTTPVSTETPGTDVTPSTTPATGGGTTPTTKPSTQTTSKPSSTTTTGHTISVSADRERDAQVMAGNLATAVINYFLTGGDISDVARHVVPAAQPSLTQMIGRLDSPTSGQVVQGSAKAIDSNTVRFTLEFVDVNDTLRFFVWVHVDDQGATITKISAAS